MTANAVYVWRLEYWISMNGKISISLVIRDYQENVGLAGGKGGNSQENGKHTTELIHNSKYSYLLAL